MGHFAGVAGIRTRSGIRPDAGGRRAFNVRLRRPVVVAALAVVVLGVAAASAGLLIRHEISNTHALAAQAQANRELQSRVDSLEARANSQPDWTAVVRLVEPSVFTIETSTGLGSAWVARSEAGGSDLITNFHVVDDAWSAGDATVDVRHGDQTMKGTVTRVDRNNDLAVVHVARRFASLPTATLRPELGSMVMAVGSPLGLDGSLSVGVVSGFRSVDGSDYIQFSAPISPGNSGGPVVDAHGRVVAVASAKFEGAGVEALSLAIPAQTACTMVVVCAESPAG